MGSVRFELFEKSLGSGSVRFGLKEKKMIIHLTTGKRQLVVQKLVQQQLVV
jgi:hypothetical protein